MTKVLIIGFENNEYQEVDALLQKMIEESQCFLFYVLAGSVDSIGCQWAKKNGAPIYWMDGASEKELLKETTYLIAKLNDRSPQALKNFVMKYRETGKHGTVVR